MVPECFKNLFLDIRNDRTRHGGGVAMYIRNSINFNLRNGLHDEALEFLCVEISKPKVKPFLISTWYRPPNSCKNLFDKLQVILDKIEFHGIENNIIGYANCNMSASIADNNTKHLLELSESHPYTQLIKEPTRLTNSSSTLIDLLLTNRTTLLLLAL